MASASDEVAEIEEKIDELAVSKPDTAKKPDDNNSPEAFEPHLSGFVTRELYKIALNFYKGEFARSPIFSCSKVLIDRQENKEGTPYARLLHGPSVKI